MGYLGIGGVGRYVLVVEGTTRLEPWLLGETITLGQLEAIFAEVREVVDRLHRGVMFPVALQLVDKVCAGREILSAGLANRIQREIDLLHAGLGLARKALRVRLAPGLYPVDQFLDDLRPLDFVEPFIAFLEIDGFRLLRPAYRQNVRHQDFARDMSAAGPLCVSKG